MMDGWAALVTAIAGGAAIVLTKMTTNFIAKQKADRDEFELRKKEAREDFELKNKAERDDFAVFKKSAFEFISTIRGHLEQAMKNIEDLQRAQAQCREREMVLERQNHQQAQEIVDLRGRVEILEGKKP